MRLRIGLSFLVLAGGSLAAQPADRSELQALRAQVQQLEAQLREVSRRLEEKERAAAGAEAAQKPTTAPAGATVSVTDRGYALASPEAENSIRLRALIQADSRTFFDDDPALVNGGFVLRRARLITEGVLAKNFSYLFTTEFGGSSVSILDAALTVRLTDGVFVKGGKFKTPIGHEVLQGDAATTFTERSMLAGFLPNRDLGLVVGGDLADGRIDYVFGVMNGVADGANSSNADFDDTRDAVGRVMVSPFKPDRASAWRGLSFGLAGSTGKQRSTSARTAGYRTDGQQVFFSYLPAVTGAGDVWRISPQLDYRRGPLGIMGEYVISSAELQAATGRRAALRHDGWQVTASYVLTGEASSYGQVVPRVDFDPGAGQWGAWEVMARIAHVDLDDAAFADFASATASASEVDAYAVGLKWYLSKAVVVKLNYFHTDFGLEAAVPFAAPAPLLRRDEKAFVSRLQLAF